MIEIQSFAFIFSEFKWLFEGLAAALIIFGLNYLYQKHRDKRNLNNILILIMYELNDNYLLLVLMENGGLPRDTLLQTKSWDDSKIDIAKYAKSDIIVYLSGVYQKLKLENFLIEPSAIETIQEYKKLIYISLMKIRKISSFKPYIDLILEGTKENINKYNNSNCTSTD